MTIDRNTVASLGLTLLLITSVLPAGIVGLSGTARADDHGAWYTLSQPGTDVCYEVQAFPNDHPKMEPEVVVRGSNEVGDVTGPYKDPDWSGSEEVESIESIMDYRYRYVPEGETNADGQTEYYAPYLNDQYRQEGWEFATYGLYNWSENGDSHLWFYQNDDGEVSLVVRHDKLFENVGTASHNPYNGEWTDNPNDGFFVRSPGDGTATWEFDDLPSGEWAYLDDLYPNGLDDRYVDSSGVRYGHRESQSGYAPIREFDGGYFRAEWQWGSWNNPDGPDKHGTDGGAYRGFHNLANGESVTITNSFSGDLDEWEVRTNDGSLNGEQLDLVMGEPLVITRGQHCLGGEGELTASPNPAEAGEEVTFVAPDGAEEYRWDFDGDGAPEENTTDRSQVRTYNDSGDVQVSVTMAEGSQTVEKQTTITVRASEPPTADFRVDDEAGDPNHVVVGEQVVLNATPSSDNVALADDYRWDVNGTAESGATVPVTFDAAGEHEVTLTVTDRTGKTDNVTKRVTVFAEDDPEAEASASPTEVEAGAPITLDGSASSDERGTIESYDWDAPGGDVTAPGQNRTEVVYSEAGEYDVTLTVTDNNGNTDTANLTVSVTNATAPIIDSVNVPDEASTSGSYEVSASARDPSGSTPLAYTWRFTQDGDTETFTGETASYRFTDEGSATVELVVTDAAGQTNSTGEIEIEVTGKPNAELSVHGETKVGKTVTLDASNSSDSGEIDEYRWDLNGDGAFEKNTSASNATVTTTFGSSGDHAVSVTVVDDDGMTDTANATIAVEQEKKAVSGGGGGGGGGSSLGPPPVMTETEKVGPNEAAIDVRNGRAEETIRTSLPASEVASETGVRFEEVAVNLAGKDNHVVFETAASADAPGDVAAPSASDETLAYLDFDAQYLDASVERATVEFTVRKAALGEFATASDVTVYQYDGTWTQVNATVVEAADESVRLKATTDGLGTLAVGTNEALAVTDAQLSSSSVTTGETVEATATLQNTGSAAQSATVNLTLSGSVVASQTVEVAAGETKEVTLSGTAPTPGTYDVTVGGTSAGTLSVQEVQPADVSVADVSLNSSTIAAGEQVEVVAVVENTGGEAGQANVTLTMFGEDLATETVRVPAGETERVTFDQRVDAAGTYTVDVNGETAELQVESEDDGGLADKAPGVPGFGVGVALMALLGAALLARFRS